MKSQTTTEEEDRTELIWAGAEINVQQFIFYAYYSINRNSYYSMVCI